MHIFLWSDLCFSYLLVGGLYNIMDINPLSTICCKYFLLACRLSSTFVCSIFHCTELFFCLNERPRTCCHLFPWWFRAGMTKVQSWTGIERTIQRCPQDFFSPLLPALWLLLFCWLFVWLVVCFFLCSVRIRCPQIHLLVDNSSYFPCAYFYTVPSGHKLLVLILHGLDNQTAQLVSIMGKGNKIGCELGTDSFSWE